MSSDRFDSDIPMDGTLFTVATCPHCGADLSDEGDGLRLRIGVFGTAELVAIDDTLKRFELQYSYDQDDKREEYICYGCENVVFSIVRS